MAAERGQQFPWLSSSNVTLFRGMPIPHTSIDTRNLGQHWSEDKASAETFAAPSINSKHGTVVEAEFPKSSVVTPDSSEWKSLGGGDYESGSGIFHPDHLEKETTIRFGARPTITAFHHYTDGEHTHTTYPDEGIGNEWYE